MAENELNDFLGKLTQIQNGVKEEVNLLEKYNYSSPQIPLEDINRLKKVIKSFDRRVGKSVSGDKPVTEQFLNQATQETSSTRKNSFEKTLAIAVSQSQRYQLILTQLG